VHADRHDDWQNCLSQHLGPHRLAPARPFHRPGALEELIGHGDVLATLRKHASIGSREGRWFPVDGQDDEGDGLRYRSQCAYGEGGPLLAIVEIDLTAADGVTDVGELGFDRIEMGVETASDEIDHDLVAFPR
jgi:hypothetical protein